MFEDVYRNINQPNFNPEAFREKFLDPNPKKQLQLFAKMLKDPEFTKSVTPQGLENLRAASKILVNDSGKIHKLFYKAVFGIEKSIDRCEKRKLFALFEEKKFDEISLILPTVLGLCSRSEKHKFLSSINDPAFIPSLTATSLQVVIKAAYREGLLFHVLESAPQLADDNRFKKQLKMILTEEITRSSKNDASFIKSHHSTIIIHVGKKLPNCNLELREAVSECIAESYLEVVAKYHNNAPIHPDMKHLATDAIVWRLLLGSAPVIELPFADKGCSLRVLKEKIHIFESRLLNHTWFKNQTGCIHNVLKNTPSVMDRIAVKVWLSYERYLTATAFSK